MNEEKHPKPSWVLMVVTVANLIFVGVMVGSSAIFIVAVFLPGFAAIITPYTFFGCFLIIPPGALFWIVIYASVFKRRQWAVDWAPKLYAIAAAFCLFAVVSEICASPTERGSNMGWMLCCGLLIAGIAAYLIFCMFLADRWRRNLRSLSTRP